MTDALLRRFDLTGRVAIVTGGAGLLGREHGAALLEAGATVVLADLNPGALKDAAESLDAPAQIDTAELDVTDPASVTRCLEDVLAAHGRADVLVNNAARNPKVEDGRAALSRLEALSLHEWSQDLAVGLTGAMLCGRTFGSWMAANGGGVILNIASDLAVIAPDQRLYRDPSLRDDEQPVKPVSYSVVKTGLVGLTRYLATYWADKGVRTNALSPGGVLNEQPTEFVSRVSELIPLGRMAARDEYRAAVQFLCSDASLYMTGQNIVMDGGRTVW